jgi:hypothetical protein
MFKFIIIFFISGSLFLHSQKLELEWSSFIGGSGTEVVESICSDDEGNVYVFGYTTSIDFNVTENCFQSSFKGANDLFLMKFSKDMDLLWSTYIGGSNNEYPKNMKYQNGNIWIVADSKSSNFPTTEDAFQKKLNSYYDGIFMKFNKSGELLYSSYLGSSGYDVIDDLVFDKEGNVWFTGRTYAEDFPVTANATQKTKSGGVDSFIAKFNSDGQIIYSSFLGGNKGDFAMDIAYNEKSNIIAIIGYTQSSDFPTTKQALHTDKIGDSSFDSFISYYNLDGEIIWSSYLGGTSIDYGEHITKNNNDGFTFRIFSSSNEINKLNNPGSFSSYLASIDKNGILLWDTFHGGNSLESEDNIYNKGGDLKLEGEEFFFSGFTSSSNFPTTSNAYQTSKNGDTDVSFSELDRNGNLLLSSYLGGRSSDEGRSIMSRDGKIYVVGWTKSSDFPVTDSTFDDMFQGKQDGFISIFKEGKFCQEVFNSSESGFGNIDARSNKDIDESKYVKLTEYTKNDMGYIYHKNKVNISGGFTTNFSFVISSEHFDLLASEKTDFLTSEETQGADGLAFVVSGDDPKSINSSQNEGSIGYDGFNNSVAYEIDLFKNLENNDPNDNHAAFNVPEEKGGLLKSKNTDETTLFLDDNILDIKNDSTQIYYARVEYFERTLSFYLGDTKNFTEPIKKIENFDFNNHLNLEFSDNAYVWITSSTGDLFQRHYLLHWDFCTYDETSIAASSKDEVNNNNFLCYPNPTEGRINFNIPEGFNQNIEVVISNLLGERITTYSFVKTSRVISLELNDLPMGAYIYNINDGNNNVNNGILYLNK